MGATCARQKKTKQKKRRTYLSPRDRQVPVIQNVCRYTPTEWERLLRGKKKKNQNQKKKRRRYLSPPDGHVAGVHGVVDVCIIVRLVRSRRIAATQQCAPSHIWYTRCTGTPVEGLALAAVAHCVLYECARLQGRGRRGQARGVQVRGQRLDAVWLGGEPRGGVCV